MNFEVTAKIRLYDADRKRPSHVSVSLEADSNDRILFMGLLACCKSSARKLNPELGEITSITLRLGSGKHQQILIHCLKAQAEKSFVLNDTLGILEKLKNMISARENEFQRRYRSSFIAFDSLVIKPVFRETAHSAIDGRSNLKRNTQRSQ